MLSLPGMAVKGRTPGEVPPRLTVLPLLATPLAYNTPTREALVPAPLRNEEWGKAST